MFERELARAIGHLQGYDPAAARLNLVGADRPSTETAGSVTPETPEARLPCGCPPERPVRAWSGTPPPGWKPGDPAPHVCPDSIRFAMCGEEQPGRLPIEDVDGTVTHIPPGTPVRDEAPQPPGHETPLPPRIPGA